MLAKFGQRSFATMHLVLEQEVVQRLQLETLLDYLSDQS
jgi:hypothetical protein